MTCRILPLLLVLAVQPMAQAQKNYPPAIQGAKVEVYKQVGDVSLNLWGFYPDDWSASDARPAVIFFFGGGWTGGSPTQFVPHSEYLAKRGMVALVADYRVRSRHQTKGKVCVEDARDAMRYVRAEAGRLGIDPDRLAAGGGSAGGHLAACLGTIEDDAASKANAMFLFNPACVLAPYEGKTPWNEDRSEELRERMGVEPQSLSPIHHITASAPPAVIFHGEADDTVPFVTAQWFSDALKEVGVVSVLNAYPGESHGFFNANRKPVAGAEPVFPKTLRQLDAFLADLGWLEP